MSEKPAVESDFAFDWGSCFTAFVQEQPFVGIEDNRAYWIDDYPCLVVFIWNKDFIGSLSFNNLQR